MGADGGVGDREEFNRWLSFSKPLIDSPCRYWLFARMTMRLKVACFRRTASAIINGVVDNVQCLLDEVVAVIRGRLY